ncbi:hypothetical protein C1646_776025 [Rhizophagus diaphanus]|nr:hypothetical protein C1646_776025 [Rhizophagus diaphanus] [Rhizophagus sp. MUCL 43196]
MTRALCMVANITSRVFYHDYPDSPYIDAQYTLENKIFHLRYKIIALGHYPENVKYMQKSSRSAVQYQILDRYIVKMEVADKVVHCKTKYTLLNKVLYTITWKEGQAEWSKINQEKSRLSGIQVFGFDIEILHQTLKKIKQLILQHRMFSESEEPIHLCNMELEYEEHIINIKYNLSLNYIKLDAYVRVFAQRRIEITKLINEQIPIGIINLDKEFNQQLIFDDEEHQGNPDEIIVDKQEIGNGVYRSIRNLLQILIPIWNSSNPPILQPENTINLKLGEDGRNVGCKQNHVMMTVFIE